MTDFQIIQGDRRILQSGSIVVTRKSPPVLLVHDGAELLIEFDLDKPFTRKTGEVVKPAFDANAAGLADTEEAPKIRPLGDARVEYFLAPSTLPESYAPDETGRMAQLSYLFNYRIDVPSEGRTTTVRPAFDWLGPQPSKTHKVEKIVDPRFMTPEQRSQWVSSRPARGRWGCLCAKRPSSAPNCRRLPSVTAAAP